MGKRGCWRLLANSWRTLLAGQVGPARSLFCAAPNYSLNEYDYKMGDRCCVFHLFVVVFDVFSYFLDAESIIQGTACGTCVLAATALYFKAEFVKTETVIL